MLADQNNPAHFAHTLFFIFRVKTRRRNGNFDVDYLGNTGIEHLSEVLFLENNIEDAHAFKNLNEAERCRALISGISTPRTSAEVLIVLHGIMWSHDHG